MNTQLIEEVEEFVKNKFSDELNKGFSYHNFEHTSLVKNAAIALAKEVGLNPNDEELLVISALFHDLGFVIDPDTHEEQSCKMAREFLVSKNYEPKDIETVASTIMATKLGTTANTQLERLLQDADLSGLGSDNYSEICENLRNEINFRYDKKQGKKKWKKENVKFLESHHYNTQEAKDLYQEQKVRNIETLKKMKKNKNKELLTIGSSKSAQTQVKTALRNHIDLSSIADNKANIMLSVNAIVITVGLPLILDRLITNPDLLIPLILLAIASLGSMIFATLSTRPAKMLGTTNGEQILAKKSNLFFFGNYYNMNFEEYEEGMRTVVGDNEILDNSITRDLFFLGKSLGKKYEYLRYCYNIFMYGIVASLLSYAVVVIISCNQT